MNKRKLLILLSFLIVIILIMLLIFSTRGSNKVPDSAFEQMGESVLIQGESILKYDDYVFLLDDLSNSIIKYDTKNLSGTVIANYNNEIGKHIYVMNNKLIYTLGGTTYCSDLNGGQVEKFSNGEVLYLNEDIYIYVVQNSAWQNLYITSYDNKTFRITNDFSFNLAKGYEIDFLKSMGDNLYFTSNNSDGSVSLFEVDLKEYKTSVIAKKATDNEAANKIAFADVVKNNRNYYYIVDNIVETTYNEAVSSSVMWLRPIDASYDEFAKSNVGRRFVVESNNILYEMYNSETGKYEWRNIYNENLEYTWKELLYGNVTKYFKLKDSSIYMDDEKLVDLNGEYLNYWTEKVIRFEDGLYILIASDTSHKWYFCKEDGSGLVEIYNYEL